MLTISIIELEQAINSARRAFPPLDGVLAADVRLMAEIYGELIYAKADAINLDQQPSTKRDAVLRWLPAEPSRASLCAVQPGRTEAEGCDVCQ